MADTAASRTIHIAAPDDTLRRALSEHLAPSDGWRVTVSSGAPNSPLEAGALAILDLGEPAERRGTLDAIRGQGFDGPILILGGVDGVGFLEDEPIPRPVRLGTLLARIDAHWARPPDGGRIVLGPYEFVPVEHLLRDTGSDEVIRLTELERRLLSFLAEADGGLIDRDRLLAQVWGYSAGVDTHTVETHIWRLRQKIETDDPATRFLVTEAGGYRLLLAGSDEGG